MEALDRRFAELEERFRRGTKILCVAQAISYGTGKDKEDTRTYRSEKEKCLFQIPEVGNVLCANSSWNILNEGMEFLKRRFLQNWADYVLFNVADALRAQEVFGGVLKRSGVGGRLGHGGTGDGDGGLNGSADGRMRRCGLFFKHVSVGLPRVQTAGWKHTATGACNAGADAAVGTVVMLGDDGLLVNVHGLGNGDLINHKGGDGEDLLIFQDAGIAGHMTVALDGGVEFLEKLGGFLLVVVETLSVGEEILERQRAGWRAFRHVRAVVEGADEVRRDTCTAAEGVTLAE